MKLKKLLFSNFLLLIFISVSLPVYSEHKCSKAKISCTVKMFADVKKSKYDQKNLHKSKKFKCEFYKSLKKLPKDQDKELPKDQDKENDEWYKLNCVENKKSTPITESDGFKNCVKQTHACEPHSFSENIKDGIEELKKLIKRERGIVGVVGIMLAVYWGNVLRNRRKKNKSDK